jgi:hypothetical protein
MTLSFIDYKPVQQPWGQVSSAYLCMILQMKSGVAMQLWTVLAKATSSTTVCAQAAGERKLT